MKILCANCNHFISDTSNVVVENTDYYVFEIILDLNYDTHENRNCIITDDRNLNFSSSEFRQNLVSKTLCSNCDTFLGWFCVYAFKPHTEYINNNFILKTNTIESV